MHLADNDMLPSYWQTQKIQICTACGLKWVHPKRWVTEKLMRSVSRGGGMKWTWMLNHKEMDGAIKACDLLLWDFWLFLPYLYLISLFMCLDEMDARVTRKQIVAWKLSSILGVLDISDLAFPLSFSFINLQVISKFEFLLQPWGCGSNYLIRNWE